MNGVLTGMRAVRWSWLMLVAVPVSLVASVFWAIQVETSPTVADADRIRGWESVVRELPATLLVVLVFVAGFGLAIRGGRTGDAPGAMKAIGAHGAALFFMLLVIVNGSVENIMTTRPSTVKWMLLPAQLTVAIAAVALSRRAVMRRSAAR